MGLGRSERAREQSRIWPGCAVTACLFWKPSGRGDVLHACTSDRWVEDSAQDATHQKKAYAPGPCVAQPVKCQSFLFRVHGTAGAAAGLPRRDTFDSAAPRRRPQHVILDSKPWSYTSPLAVAIIATPTAGGLLRRGDICAQVSRAPPASLSSRSLLPRGLDLRTTATDPGRLFGRGSTLAQARAAEVASAGDGSNSTWPALSMWPVNTR